MKLLLSLMLTSAAILGAAQAGQNSGMISGAVTRPGGTEGISGVDILLVGPLTGTAANAAASNPLMIAEIAEGASVPRASVVTESDGRFVFRNLAPGQYTVRAQREGHFGATPAGAGGLVSIVTAPVTVSVTTATPEVRLTMVRGATISGRVRDSSGQAAVNIPVTAYELAYREGRQTLSVARTRSTDDRGDFRIYWLPPGQFYIAATPPRSTGAGPSAGLRTFFPGATDFASASPLSVSEGVDVSAIDINLPPTPAVKVSGRVVNTLPALNSSPRVVSPAFFLLPRDPGMLIEPSMPSYQNFSTTPGEFELRGVPPGSYDLVATVPDSTGRAYPGRVAVDVGNRDLEGVTVSIHPGSEVKVRIFLDGKLVPAQPSAPATPVRPAVRALLRSKETYPSLFETAAASNATTDATGAYVFPSVPAGLYSVQAAAMPANSYVADIREGGVSIYDGGLVVGDRAQPLIDVIVSSGAQTIRGTVRNAEGNPVTSASAVLVPPMTRRKNLLLYRTSRTSFTGEFTINNVPPGDYKLFAWESIPNTAYMNAAFMEKYESRGRAVTLTTGGEANFDLTVIKD